MGLRKHDRLQDFLGVVGFYAGKILLILLGIYIGWEFWG